MGDDYLLHCRSSSCCRATLCKCWNRAQTGDFSQTAAPLPRKEPASSRWATYAQYAERAHAPVMFPPVTDRVVDAPSCHQARRSRAEDRMRLSVDAEEAVREPTRMANWSDKSPLSHTCDPKAGEIVDLQTGVHSHVSFWI